MKVQDLLEVQSDDKEYLIKYLLRLYEIHEELKVLKKSASSTSDVRNKMFKAEERLAEKLAQIFEPILGIEKDKGYWLAQKKNDNDAMNLGDLIDSDDEASVELKKKLAARKAKLASKFTLQVAVESGLSTIRDNAASVVEEFKSIFGPSTKVEMKLSGTELNMYVTIDVKSLQS